MGRDASVSLRALASVTDSLRNDRIDSKVFDPESARQILDEMDALLQAPETLPDHLSNLKNIADTAASWAAAAPTASREMHIAVTIRGAAGDLRGHALRPSAAHLASGRRRRGRGRYSLESWLYGVAPPEPGRGTGGRRDQNKNQEESQRETRPEVDEPMQQ